MLHECSSDATATSHNDVAIALAFQLFNFRHEVASINRRSLPAHRGKGPREYDFVRCRVDGGERVIGRGLTLEILGEPFVDGPTHDVHLGSGQEREDGLFLGWVVRETIDEAKLFGVALDARGVHGVHVAHRNQCAHVFAPLVPFRRDLVNEVWIANLLRVHSECPMFVSPS